MSTPKSTSSVAEGIKNPIGTNGISSFKPTGTIGNGSPFSKRYENDELYEQLSDLVSKDFRRWFCGQFYRLGRERVLTLASVARADGKQPKKLFCKLLKEAA